MKIPERAIQSQILQWLGYHHIKAFRINAGMVRTGEGRSSRIIRMAPKGFSDIMGVLPGGRAIFIEVKAKGGKPTQMQLDFLGDMIAQGAIALVAYCTEDVEKELGV